ncbi:MAG: hypothetical protein JW395_1112 [Nitrospira sp.]|nr:hypothetical protein [Nitrospira sp.]
MTSRGWSSGEVYQRRNEECEGLSAGCAGGHKCGSDPLILKRCQNLLGCLYLEPTEMKWIPILAAEKILEYRSIRWS